MIRRYLRQRLAGCESFDRVCELQGPVRTALPAKLSFPTRQTVRDWPHRCNKIRRNKIWVRLASSLPLYTPAFSQGTDTRCSALTGCGTAEATAGASSTCCWCRSAQPEAYRIFFAVRLWHWPHHLKSPPCQHGESQTILDSYPGPESTGNTVTPTPARCDYRLSVY